MRAIHTTVILGATALLLVSGAASASYPAGVWTKVRQVDYEPDATSPTKVRVHGAAMLFDNSTGTTYTGYTEPAWGFLYYECPKGEEQTCKDEWADLEKNIAESDDVCVGFGSQNLKPGTLRPWGSKALFTPDTYPIEMGVLSGFSPCKVIADFIDNNPAPGSGGQGGQGGSAGGGAAGSGSGGSAGSGSGGEPGSGGASTGGTSSATGGSASGTGGGSGGDDDDGGCSVSVPTGSTGGLGWLGALALLGLGVRRRVKRG
ncbi:MAG: hypothetical protein KF718_32750 [Polyangiaceae bacterium]|nr:hypothetical protein [Polyangiaceae bacterium]